MGAKVFRTHAQGSSRFPSSGPHEPLVSSRGIVCSFWLAGTCSRNPCRFLHSDTTAPMAYTASLNQSCHPKQYHYSHGQSKNVYRKAGEEQSQLYKPRKPHIENSSEGYPSSLPPFKCTGTDPKSLNKICEYWMAGNCIHGDKCKYMHSWSHGNGLSILAHLEGHKKAVTGITLPSGSDKLFSSSKDGTVKVWNCHTGECIDSFEMGSPVGCLISEGPWVFVGLKNIAEAWNIQTNVELTLSAPGGQIYAMSVTTNGMLLAGVHDGSILAWNFNSGTNTFEATTSLRGHASAVVSLVVGGGRLYSGSMDNTIRVWNLDNLQCIHTLNKHSGVMTSMVCWDQFLISCSLDKT